MENMDIRITRENDPGSAERKPLYVQADNGKHDVEVSVIGESSNSGKATVKCSKGKVIMDMETEFLHDGNPKMHLQTKLWTNPPAVISKPSPIIRVADTGIQQADPANILCKNSSNSRIECEMDYSVKHWNDSTIKESVSACMTSSQETELKEMLSRPNKHMQ